MRRYDVIAEICDYMLELDWKPYQNDHEDANGQFEMNWEYDDVLRAQLTSIPSSNLWSNQSRKNTAYVRPLCQSLSKASPETVAMRIFRYGIRLAKPMSSPMIRWS